MKLTSITFLALALMPPVFAQAQAGKTTTEQQAKVEQQAKKEATWPESYYKLNFIVSEVEDSKRVNQREYSMIVKSNDNRQTTVKASTRVPIVTSDNDHTKQFTYADVGLQISCSMLRELTDKVAVNCDVEISSILPDQTSDARNSLGPVLRTTSARFAWAVLTANKPSTFTTIDDVNSKKRIQVEATATRVD
jgi:hypothetical protein